MAETVVPSGGAAETFEHAFNRAVLQSERLRLSVVILMLLAIMLRWLFVWLFMPGVLQGQLGGALNLAALGILGLVALVMVSETVMQRLGGLPEQATAHGAIQVKGREQPVEVYALA